MATLNELLQDYVNLSYDDLLQIANRNFNKIAPFFARLSDDGNPAKYIVPIVGAALAVDGKLSQLEYKFINDLLGGGLSYDAVLQLANNNYNTSSMEYTDKVVDALNGEERTALLALCLCIMAVDETISREEVSFIKRLIA